MSEQVDLAAVTRRNVEGGSMAEEEGLKTSNEPRRTKCILCTVSSSFRLYGVLTDIFAFGIGQLLKKSKKSNLLELLVIDGIAQLNECETVLPCSCLALAMMRRDFFIFIKQNL
uniref:Uncharacterized protein n=1 Tax=Setaria italica TaxID=4555 RepID=K4AJR9_SETIT